jgi:CheY-like chemotaxis protein/chemotaxis signal transduction protein
MALPLILLVDDSEAVLRFEQAVLGQSYRCRLALDGAAALAAMQGQAPDAVLLDLSMPVMDGDEVLRCMRAQPGLDRLPVLVVTSEPDRGEACRALGAWGVLAKPLAAEQLLHAVDQMLREAEASRLKDSVGILPADSAGERFAIPLDRLEAVLAMPATSPLSRGGLGLRRWVEWQGRAVPVLDAARLRSRPSQQGEEERWLVLLNLGWGLLALAVDSLGDPERVLAADVERQGGACRVRSAAGSLLPLLELGDRRCARLARRAGRLQQEYLSEGVAG